MTTHTPSSLTIETKHLRLTIAPQVGASIAAFEYQHNGVWLPIMRAAPQPLPITSSNYSSFTLAPYSNRIRSAQFSFSGDQYQLKATTPEGNAQHGDVRNRPWQAKVYPGEYGNVIDGQLKPIGTLQSLTCTFDSRAHSDINWPWPFIIEKQYHLRDNCFITEIKLTNVSDQPMPAGFGFHPYFSRSLGEAKLTFQSRGYYQTDESFIPAEGMRPVPAELECAVERVIGQQSFNHCFAWNHSATLRWAGQPFALRISASEVFEHLVVYTAPDGTLAIEPVTNCTDGFNLFARGISGTGVRVLQPGEALRGEVHMHLG